MQTDCIIHYNDNYKCVLGGGMQTDCIIHIHYSDYSELFQYQVYFISTGFPTEV